MTSLPGCATHAIRAGGCDLTHHGEVPRGILPTFRRWAKLLLCGLLLWQTAWADAPPRIIHYGPTGAIYDYRWALLALALQHTRGSDGPWRLEPFDEQGFSQDRTIALLLHGELDITAFGYTPEREAILRPVRIDLLRGMLGYRLLLIRADRQAYFSHLDVSAFRRDVILGFNSQWADLAVLQANNLRLVTSPHYDNLFAMLNARRFDAFPRGLNEVRRELQHFGPVYPDLAVEQGWALYMQDPVYFWVRKGDGALAARIERGLNLALADGSFKALFLSYHGKDIAAAAYTHRRVIVLNNPYLPRWYVPSDTGWWWPHHP